MDTDQHDSIVNGHTVDSISLKWNHTNPRPDNYTIKYRPLKPVGGFAFANCEENCIVLQSLQSGMPYDIIIRAGESNKIIYRTEAATDKSPADVVFSKSTKDINNPDIYQLPTKETGLENGVHCLQLDLDPSQDFTYQNFHEKTIILLGDQDSGKTTLVNAMINYIAGVNFADNRRLKISCEKEHDNVVSHCYRISTQEYFQIQCQLNIIDVSTFHTEQNANFESLIKALNNLGIYMVDAFCIVMPMNCHRRSDSDNIFNYILKHFPSTNILPMITFYDGGVIQDLTDLTYFKFNNSDVLTSTHDPQNWNQRQKTLESFFKHLSTIEHVNISINESSSSERLSVTEPTRSCSKCIVCQWIAFVCIFLGSCIFGFYCFVNTWCVCRRHR